MFYLENSLKVKREIIFLTLKKDLNSDVEIVTTSAQIEAYATTIITLAHQLESKPRVFLDGQDENKDLNRTYEVRFKSQLCLQEGLNLTSECLELIRKKYRVSKKYRRHFL